MRLPKRGPVALVSKSLGVVFGLLRRDVFAAEKLTTYFLWSLPKDQIEAHLEEAPRLPATALREGFYPDREAMLRALPKGGTIAEVGTWQGHFSRLIAQICKPTKFHLIDLDFSELGVVPGAVERHQGDSSTILKSFSPNTFDWIYIDGDHRYDGVRNDLDAAHSVLRPGGFLMCNDYTNWCSPSVTPYGVARAVNEFVISRGYTVEGLAFHPAGLHDILIRKPE